MTSTSFADLGVPAPLVAVLAADGKTEPFPIQADTLPDTLAGRDVLGRGKTGSGKTIAFALPLAARLAGGRRSPGRPRGLVLAPTRELATQIQATLQPLAAALGLTTTTVFGGVSQNRQVAALRAGVDILVACPGRLDDLMKQGFVTLDAVEITVLDEADHMADLGFLPVVTRLLDKTPKGGQRLLFSATLDNGVDKLVARFLRNEVLHSVDEATSHVEAMTHHVFEVANPDEKKNLVEVLASGTGRRILFTRTKHQAKRLAKQLTATGIPAVDLHGNLSQGARDRNLAAFGAGDVRVLVATDVAARGVHVDDVQLVVHVDPPAEHKAYLHRSGRTARAGSAGDVVTVMLSEQAADVRTLLRHAAITAAPQRVTAESAAVTALVGEVAPRVAAWTGGLGSGGGAGTGSGSGSSGGGAGRGGRGGRGRGGAAGQGGRAQGGRSQDERAQGGRGQGGRGQGGRAQDGRAQGDAPGGAQNGRTQGGRTQDGRIQDGSSSNGRRRRRPAGAGAAASGDRTATQNARGASATAASDVPTGNRRRRGHGSGAAPAQQAGHGSARTGRIRVGDLVDASTRRGHGTRRAQG